MAKQLGIETTSKFKSNYKKVQVGNTIQFHRKGYDFEGEVTVIREMTVIVLVDPTSVPSDLVFENNITVVSHGKYKIKHKPETIAG